MSREIEMKFRIDNKNTFIDKLNSLGVVLSDYKNQHDKIYMLEGKSFEDLDKGMYYPYTDRRKSTDYYN